MENHERRPFVSLLICDFDGTITTNESIALLAITSLASSKSKVSSIPPWSFFVDAYEKDHAEHQFRWRSILGNNPTLDDYFAFLESLRTVENVSIDRIVSHAVLAGLTRAELVECGRAIPKRTNFEDVCSNFLSSGQEPQTLLPRELHILSLNWSKDFIRGAMLDVRGFDDRNIHSNDLVFDNNGVTMGQIERHVVTAADKVRIAQQLTHDGWRGNIDQDTQGGKTALSVYIGDSSTDLPSMVTADIGIIMGASSSLMAICEKYGISVVEGLPTSISEIMQHADVKQGSPLYRVDGWDVIARSGLLS